MILYIGVPHEVFFVKDVVSGTDEVKTLTCPLDINEILHPALKEAYNHIIIDVNVFTNPVSEIIDVLHRLHSTGNANIIIVAKGYNSKSEMIQGLYFAGFINFILSSTLATMKDELDKCITGYYNINGVPFEAVTEAAATNENNSSLTMETIKQAQKRKLSVAVCGASSKIGSTTQALQICKYLGSIGYKACYIEMNNSGYYETLLELYSDSEYTTNESLGLIKYGNVDIYYKKRLITSILKLDYDFFVYDYGTYQSNHFEEISFLEKDIRIFVCGYKPNEFIETNNVIANTMDIQCHYIFNFIPEDDRSSMKELMMEKTEFTHFANACMDPYFYSTSNNKTYEAIFALPAQDKKSKKKLFRKRGEKK